MLNFVELITVKNIIVVEFYLLLYSDLIIFITLIGKHSEGARDTFGFQLSLPFRNRRIRLIRRIYMDQH